VSGQSGPSRPLGRPWAARAPRRSLPRVISLGIATLLSANRPVCIVPTWLTNPVAIPPVYAFTYFLGSFFWPGPDPAEVTRAMAAAAEELGALDLLAIRAQLGVFLDLGMVGMVAAAVTYPVTLRTVQRLRARRKRRGAKRRS
jgi:uncharacterized protein (DUF2062 family)